MAFVDTRERGPLAFERASATLRRAAVAWNGEYYDAGARSWDDSCLALCTGPSGRVDAVVGGVEVVARVLTDGQTLVRGYAAVPVPEHVSLRRHRRLRWPPTRWLGGARTGDAVIDGALVAIAAGPRALRSFLGEELTSTLRELVTRVFVDELTYRYGAVRLLARGIPIDLDSLEAMVDVAVAAGRWRIGSAYR
jgi:hypothetical protein